MKVMLVPGPRNEELILMIRNVLNGSFHCGEFENGYTGTDEESRNDYRMAAFSKIEEDTASKEEFLDAVYYACSQVQDDLEDREAYLEEQMYGDEFVYFVEALSNGAITYIL